MICKPGASLGYGCIAILIQYETVACAPAGEDVSLGLIEEFKSSLADRPKFRLVV